MKVILFFLNHSLLNPIRHGVLDSCVTRGGGTKCPDWKKCLKHHPDTIQHPPDTTRSPQTLPRHHPDTPRQPPDTPQTPPRHHLSLPENIQTPLQFNQAAPDPADTPQTTPRHLPDTPQTPPDTPRHQSDITQTLRYSQRIPRHLPDYPKTPPRHTQTSLRHHPDAEIPPRQPQTPPRQPPDTFQTPFYVVIINIIYF